MLAARGVIVVLQAEANVRSSDQLPKAMGLLEQSIRSLGRANQMGGLQYYATTERGETELRDSFGSKYWYVIGVTEGAEGTLRRHALYEYCSAAEIIAGRPLPKDDPAAILGFRKFARAYGMTGREGKNARIRALHALTTATQKNAGEIPIEHYYDPTLEVYAESSLRLTTPWKGIVLHLVDYKEGETVNLTLDTETQQLLHDVLCPESPVQLLTSKESQAVINDPTSYAAKIGSVIQKSRLTKHEVGDRTKKIRQDALEASHRGVRKVLEAHRDLIGNHLGKLRLQADSADQLAAYFVAQAGEKSYRHYKVTNKSLAVIKQTTDDLMGVIAAQRGYNDEQKARFTETVAAKLQRPEYAREFVEVLAAYIQEKQIVLEQNERSVSATLATYKQTKRDEQVPPIA